MQELVRRVSAATGLPEEKAERAVAIVLSLVKRHGDPSKVGDLFRHLPGADELADRHGGDGARDGGLLGLLGGGAMGGPLVAVAKLQAAGLTMDDIKTLGREVLAYARERAGEPLVREAAGSIPGLSSYL